MLKIAMKMMKKQTTMMAMEIELKTRDLKPGYQFRSRIHCGYKIFHFLVFSCRFQMNFLILNYDDHWQHPVMLREPRWLGYYTCHTCVGCVGPQEHHDPDPSLSYSGHY